MKHILFLTLLAATTAAAQQPFAEPGLAFTTRMRTMALADVGISTERLQLAATASFETGTKLDTYGAHAGYIMRLGGYYGDEFLTLYAGAAWTDNSAKVLEGNSQITAIAGMRYHINHAAFHLRYQGGTIMAGFSYRFQNMMQ